MSAPTEPDAADERGSSGVEFATGRHWAAGSPPQGENTAPVAVPVPLADCAAMAPLLAAFARGTKRSRLRQLVIVCPAGHTLIEVFPTPAGPHAVWRHMTVWGRDGDGNPVMVRRLEWLTAPVAELAGAATAVEAAACRCTESADVDGPTLSDLLEAGTRRAMLDT